MVSADGKSIAFTRYRADEKDSDVYVARLADENDAVKVTPHDGEHTHWLAGWAPSGKELLITSNAGNKTFLLVGSSQ